MRWPRIGGPRSLVRRFSLLVLVVGLASLATQAMVLRLWTEPLFEDHAQALASQVRIIQGALRHAAPADRSALAQTLSRGPVTLARLPPAELHGLRLDPMPGEGRAGLASAVPNGVSPPGAAPATAFATRLASVLGAVRLHDSFPGHLVFELPVDDERWWLTLRAPVPPQVLVDTVLLWLGVLGLAAVVATVFGLRWIARPVHRLAGQLAAQRGSLQPLATDARASTEIQVLVSAFNEQVHANAMAASLRQQLLAGVSHDLRTPLARLRLRIETQCEPPLSDALEADLLALQHIVDQFLAYVQGDTGLRLGAEQPLVQTMRDLADRYAAQGLAVVADLRLAPGDPGPSWPEVAARRLIENLVGNALAHGQAPVSIQLAREGLHWRLAVQDEGPGIPVVEFERARQPFVRLNETRGELGHCGLGLAIVDQLAAQLGAQLGVQPRDVGHRFAVWVRWPVDRDGPAFS